MRIDWVRDEIILAAALAKENGWRGVEGTDPRVIELSRVLNLSPLHPMADRDATFRNPNGVGRKTWDVATRHPDYTGKPTNGNKLDRQILTEFLEDPVQMTAIASEIRASIERGDVEIPPVDDVDFNDAEAQEGKLLLARHLRRERNPRLRKKKIDSVRAQGKPVACEVCTFDFATTYGHLGTDYIEVHHVLPLYISGVVKTRLPDLALLCANCHRMIHRGPSWLTPDALRALLT
jgi:5-methylcytosine-specific restriction protein A